MKTLISFTLAIVFSLAFLANGASPVFNEFTVDMSRFDTSHQVSGLVQQAWFFPGPFTQDASGKSFNGQSILNAYPLKNSNQIEIYSFFLVNAAPA